MGWLRSGSNDVVLKMWRSDVVGVVRWGRVRRESGGGSAEAAGLGGWWVAATGSGRQGVGGRRVPVMGGVLVLIMTPE